MHPWCCCKDTKGYVSLRDELNTFVCVDCLKPTWMIYDKSHKLCDECGMSFFSPWEEICKQCRLDLQALALEIGEGEDADEILLRCHNEWLAWNIMAERYSRVLKGRLDAWRHRSRLPSVSLG